MPYRTQKKYVGIERVKPEIQFREYQNEDRYWYDWFFRTLKNDTIDELLKTIDDSINNTLKKRAPRINTNNNQQKNAQQILNDDLRENAGVQTNQVRWIQLSIFPP